MPLKLSRKFKLTAFLMLTQFTPSAAVLANDCASGSDPTICLIKVPFPGGITKSWLTIKQGSQKISFVIENEDAAKPGIFVDDSAAPIPLPTARDTAGNYYSDSFSFESSKKFNTTKLPDSGSGACDDSGLKYIFRMKPENSPGQFRRHEICAEIEAQTEPQPN